jgi:hypothetical protein
LQQNYGFSFIKIKNRTLKEKGALGKGCPNRSSSLKPRLEDFSSNFLDEVIHFHHLQ